MNSTAHQTREVSAATSKAASLVKQNALPVSLNTVVKKAISANIELIQKEQIQVSKSQLPIVFGDENILFQVFSKAIRLVIPVIEHPPSIKFICKTIGSNIIVELIDNTRSSKATIAPKKSFDQFVIYELLQLESNSGISISLNQSAKSATLVKIVIAN